MKIFTLNDPIVRKIRASHPMLQGQKLIGSGQFSGVFEGIAPNTVLKLSIDEASYKFHTRLKGHKSAKHFSRMTDDFGIVGTFTTSKNITRTALTNPIELNVPIYLYEVEKLEKIKPKTDNRKLAMRLTKDWRSIDHAALHEDYCKRVGKIVSVLADQDYYRSQPSILQSLDFIAEFMLDYDGAFVDLHGANMMQRDDGTFVFSDPVGDSRIYNSHFTFKPVTEITTQDMIRLKDEYSKVA